MAKRRGKQATSARRKSAVGAQRVNATDGSAKDDGDSWELVHPKCVQERADDIEDVEQMLAMGEFEIAQDELRWLLADCSEFITAHKMLGEIAMGDEDLKLARAHFGYAYHAGNLALEYHNIKSGLPYATANNSDFLEAAKGLAWCLSELGKRGEAMRIAQQIVQLDPTDPLNVQDWINAWRSD